MSEQRSLLVVDDVPEILDVLSRLAQGCKTHELEVVVASDPREAIRLLEARDFDLVISDFRMPNVDGLAVLWTARQRNPGGRRILMTGYNEIPVAREALIAADLWAEIGKPIDAATFVATISAALAQTGEDRVAIAQRRYDEAALTLWRLQTSADKGADRLERLAAIERLRSAAAALRKARSSAPPSGERT